MNPWATIMGGLGGAILGGGLWLLLHQVGPGTSTGRADVTEWLGWARARLVPLVGAVIAALVAAAFTGWIAAGILVAAGVWWLPRLLGPDREHQHQVERVLAVASWAESLHDLMQGASGIHQAIAATVDDAPAEIRAHVVHLDERLRQGTPPETALGEFADRVDTPNADLVTEALIHATTGQAANLAELLASLAETARDQAGTLEAIAAMRKRTRTAARMITGTSLALAVVLLVLNRDFFTPFDGPVGQIVLLAIGGLWGVGLVWMTRMSRISLGPRVLARHPTAQEVGT